MEDNNIENEFEFHKLLGKGLTAKVYLATDKRTGEQVAIKLTNPRYKKNADAEDKVLFYLYDKCLESDREICKHIISLKRPYFMGKYRGDKYIIGVMEYIDDAKDFNDIIKNEISLSDEQILKIMKTLLKVVAFLHKNNVAHRDIKAGNVLFNSKELVLIDFGFSCLEYIESDIKCEGNVGTPNYISPEILMSIKEKKPVKNWFPSDIWALGILFYFIIFFHSPFYAKSEEETMTPKDLFRLITKKEISFTYENKLIERIINECLEKDMNKRPTAEELLNLF